MRILLEGKKKDRTPFHPSKSSGNHRGGITGGKKKSDHPKGKSMEKKWKEILRARSIFGLD